MHHLARPLAAVATWILALAVGCHLPRPAGADLRADLREFIYEDRQVVDLNPRLIRRGRVLGTTSARVRITTEQGQEAVVVVITPRGRRRRPAALVQHYLGGSKDDPLIRGLMAGFVSRGFVAAAIDGRYRGQRGREISLAEAIDQALRTGKGRPWLIDTVFDMLRTVDYLQSRADVDPARIGIAGISEGGLNAWLAAAADERVAAVAPVVGVSTFQRIIDQAAGPGRERLSGAFRTALLNFAAQIGEPEVNERVVREAWNRLLPGFTGQFEATRLVPLIAPRPLLIQNHAEDELFPLDGAELVFAAARQRYAELGVPERIEAHVAPGLRHAAFDPRELARLYSWFNRWLN